MNIIKCNSDELLHLTKKIFQNNNKNYETLYYISQIEKMPKMTIMDDIRQKSNRKTLMFVCKRLNLVLK